MSLSVTFRVRPNSPAIARAPELETADPAPIITTTVAALLTPRPSAWGCLALKRSARPSFLLAFFCFAAKFAAMATTRIISKWSMPVDRRAWLLGTLHPACNRCFKGHISSSRCDPMMGRALFFG
jgi:hypothetical protein